jgi:hypothetical protein
MSLAVSLFRQTLWFSSVIIDSNVSMVNN